MADEDSNKKLEGKKKRLANLRPAKKGEVRNPNGRPKKEFCIPDILRKIGDEPSDYVIDNNGKPVTRLQSVMMKIYQKAEGGDMEAAKFIADRTEGKALERIRLNDEKDVLEIA